MKSFKTLKVSLMILMAAAFVLVARVYSVDERISPVLEVSAFEIVLGQSSQAISDITLSVDSGGGSAPAFEVLNYNRYIEVAQADQEVFSFSACYKSSTLLMAQNSILNYMDCPARPIEITRDDTSIPAISFDYVAPTVNLRSMAFLASI